MWTSNQYSSTPYVYKWDSDYLKDTKEKMGTQIQMLLGDSSLFELCMF